MRKPYKRKAPSRGGKREGAGRKFIDEELLKLLRKIETAREADLGTPDEKATVKVLHNKLVDILCDPGRHAQTQATIVRALLDEVTGKMPDRLQADVEQVTVVINKTQKPKPNPTPEEGGEPETEH
jgi:hypothetical protein